MYALTTTIDTLYDLVLRVSVRAVEWVADLFFPPLSTPNATAPEAEGAAEAPVNATGGNFSSVGEVIRRAAAAPLVEKNTVMYANTTRVPIYRNPTIEFDAEIGTIPYGEMVIVLEPRGRFYRVAWSTVEGWVRKDDIADRATYVHPTFIVGEENLVDNPNTAHVRAILGDPFGLGRSEFSLQAGEYVLYRLWKRGKRIVWPDVRPRVPGAWHTILRGAENVHIGVLPKVGAIMECVLENDTGHLAYVEAVFPDGTITISEANYPDAGTYGERELIEDEWKSLKPVFIEVN
jgi:hypothetical protein